MRCKPMRCRLLGTSAIIGAASLLIVTGFELQPATAACMPGGPCISVQPYKPHGLGGGYSGGMGSAGLSLGMGILEMLIEAETENQNAPTNRAIDAATARKRAELQRCKSLNDDGVKLANAGDNSGAIDLFGRSLQVCPNNMTTKNNLATVRTRQDQILAAQAAEQQRQVNLTQSAENVNRAIGNLMASLNDGKPLGPGLELMGPANGPGPGTAFFGQPANPTNPNLNDTSVVDLRDAKTDIVNPNVVRGDTVGGNAVNPSTNPSTPSSNTANAAAPTRQTPGTANSGLGLKDLMGSGPVVPANSGSYSATIIPPTLPTPDPPAPPETTIVRGSSSGLSDAPNENQKCLGGNILFGGKCIPAPNLNTPSDENLVTNPNAGGQLGSAQKESADAAGGQNPEKAKKFATRQFDTQPTQRGDPLGAVVIGPSGNSLVIIKKSVFPDLNDSDWKELQSIPAGRDLIARADQHLKNIAKAEVTLQNANRSREQSDMDAANSNLSALRNELGTFQERGKGIITEVRLEGNKVASENPAAPDLPNNTAAPGDGN